MSHLEPGWYYLINVKHARGKGADSTENLRSIGPEVAAMDLSGGDQQSIIAFGWHGGDNQKWEFRPAEDGLYHIRNGSGEAYITFPDDANDGKQVIVTNGPRPWEVRIGHEGHNDRDEQPSIRIFVPGTNKNLDLKDHGDVTAGNIVQLWERTPGQGQAWYFIPTDPPQ
ncbi:unnamed protein product [Rhizoctonia solani]|uniref:Ricin B lectin domain-containing protein n=1 Tax=Rhizoctonia solani TaxID=456999 RepID=A0A8H3HF22_9AGAM|nr:unnamed protein product [Rhizoctonia solani]